jgi:hypothetical protein
MVRKSSLKNAIVWPEPPKKLKFKYCFIILLSSIFNFLILTFRGPFCHKGKFAFLNQHKILNFLIPNMTYFKEKNDPLEGPFPNYSTQGPTKIKMRQKKPFLKQSYIYFANPKLHEA